MTWFTQKMARQSWLAIADGERQAAVGYFDGSAFVRLATLPLRAAEEDDEGNFFHPAYHSDVRRLNAILALPVIAQVFADILAGRLSIEQVESEIKGICNAIENTEDLSVNDFEISLKESP